MPPNKQQQKNGKPSQSLAKAVRHCLYGLVLQQAALQAQALRDAWAQQLSGMMGVIAFD